MNDERRLELARQRVRNAIRLPHHGAGPSEYDLLFEQHPDVARDLAPGHETSDDTTPDT